MIRAVGVVLARAALVFAALQVDVYVDVDHGDDEDGEGCPQVVEI